MVESIILESERSGLNPSPTSYQLCDLGHHLEPHFPMRNVGIIVHMLCGHTSYACHEG